MLYYFVCILGIVLSLINDKKRITFYIFFAILLLLACFRYGVGADYFSYQVLYTRINPSVIGEIVGGLDQQEIGFRVFGSLMKSLGISYQVYLSVVAMINLGFIARICKKHSANPTLSLLLYFCFYYLVWTFSGLREGLTISIGMFYLLECMQTRQHVKFVLIALVLVLVHTSALVLLVLYAASQIRFSRRSLVVISLVSIVVALLPLGDILSHFSGNPLIDRVLVYVEQGSGLTRIFEFKSIARILFLVIALFYYNAFARQSEKSRQMASIYIIGFALYFVLKFSELTASRIAVYAKILDIVILANIYYLYKERINKILFAALLLLMSLFYLGKELGAMRSQTQIVLDEHKLMPYTSVFERDKYDFDKRFYDLLQHQESGEVDLTDEEYDDVLEPEER